MPPKKELVFLSASFCARDLFISLNEIKLKCGTLSGPVWYGEWGLNIHCSLQSQQQRWFQWWWLHLASVSVSAVKRQVVKLTVHVEDSPVDLNDSAVKAELLTRASSHSPPLHSRRLYVDEFPDFEWKEQTLWLLSDRWRSSWRRKEWVESVWGGECSLMGSSWLEMEEERRLWEKKKNVSEAFLLESCDSQLNFIIHTSLSQLCLSTDVGEHLFLGSSVTVFVGVASSLAFIEINADVLQMWMLHYDCLLCRAKLAASIQYHVTALILGYCLFSD